jgi:hypothetical protein
MAAIRSSTNLPYWRVVIGFWLRTLLGIANLTGQAPAPHPVRDSDSRLPGLIWRAREHRRTDLRRSAPEARGRGKRLVGVDAKEASRSRSLNAGALQLAAAGL